MLLDPCSVPQLHVLGGVSVAGSDFDFGKKSTSDSMYTVLSWLGGNGPTPPGQRAPGPRAAPARTLKSRSHRPDPAPVVAPGRGVEKGSKQSP
jgi:hypothetical protein